MRLIWIKIKKNIFMKTKRLFIAVLLLAGLASSFNTHANASVVAPTCPGSGQECATGPDGTIYQKGLDQ